MTKASRTARSLAITAMLLATAACSSLPDNLDNEIVSSLAYDKTPCPDLVAERNALLARYGDPATKRDDEKPGSRPGYIPVGAATVVPDMRSQSERDRRVALGEIDAMNRSIKRRACEGARRN